MHKTWRASDVVIVLLLVALVAMAGLQLVQADRQYERTNTLIEAVERGGGMRQAVATDGGSEKQGDWLIRRLGVKIKTLNPYTYTDRYASEVLDYLFDSMIERDWDTLEWKPKMAESWEISEDKLALTFHLRRDLRWSDGEPITSSDVLFSFRTVVNPMVEASRLATYYKDVESVTAPDDYTVRFTYKRPYFLSLAFAGGLTIIPKHVYEFDDPREFNRMRQVTVCSGPYVLEDWKTGREIVLRRNERYWDEPAYFDRVVFRVTEDETAAYQKLQAEQIDMMSLSPDQWRKALNDSKIKENYRLLTYRAPSGYTYIGWNNRNDLFDDARVRRALTHLVPRKQIAEKLLHGLPEVVTGPFWPGAPEADVPLQYDRSVEPYSFDPDKALELLAEAGWRDTDGDGVLDRDGRSFEFILMIPSSAQASMTIASATREEMARVGVKVELHQLEWTVFVEKLNTRSFDACLLGWSGGVESDPYQIWHSLSIGTPENPGSNHISYENERVDRLIEQARRTFDVEKRNALYHEFHRILHEDQPYTFLFYSPPRVAVHKRFEGVTVHLLGLDTQEWWTPAASRLYVKGM